MAAVLTKLSDDQISRVESVVLAADADEQVFDLFPYFDTVGINSNGIIADQVKVYFSMVPNPVDGSKDWIQYLTDPTGDPNPWNEEDNTVVNIGARNYRKMKMVRVDAAGTDGNITMQVSRVYAKSLHA